MQDFIHKSKIPQRTLLIIVVLLLLFVAEDTIFFVNSSEAFESIINKQVIYQFTYIFWSCFKLIAHLCLLILFLRKFILEKPQPGTKRPHG
jgi:hypothetical protein